MARKRADQMALNWDAQMDGLRAANLAEKMAVLQVGTRAG